MSTATIDRTEAKARANLELAGALKGQRHHNRHRAKDGRPCPWCDAADRRVAAARAELARLSGPDAA